MLATMAELNNNILEPACTDCDLLETNESASARNALMRFERDDVPFRTRTAACIQPLKAPLLKIASRRSHHVPLAEGGGFSPCCGSCLGKFDDHASVRQCDGDPTSGHNEVRDCVAKGAT